jgi:hypothetical protein
VFVEQVLQVADEMAVPGLAQVLQVAVQEQVMAVTVDLTALIMAVVAVVVATLVVAVAVVMPGAMRVAEAADQPT